MMAFVAVAGVAAAAQTPPQRPPVFRAGVEIVRLDVSVLGKDRIPVRGLTAADFTVLEDGKPAPLVAFQPVEIDDPPPPPARWMRDVAPDVQSNDLKDSRLFVLVLDDGLIPFDPRIIKDAKQIARDVVDKLGPDDLASIIFTADNRNAQDFTADRARLHAAIDKFAPGMATYAFGFDVPAEGGGGGVDTDTHFYESSISTLARVSEFLMAVPDKRKAIIWLSPGVPVDPEAGGPMLASGVGKGLANKEIQARLMEQTGDIFRRASRANVAIYPIDPSGTGGFEMHVVSQLTKYRAPDAMNLGHRKATLSMDFLQQTAATTGGHAIVNTSDWTDGIAQVFRENSSYYLLGFQPLHAQKDGSLRRLDVKVDRPGVEVLVRDGYYADKPASADLKKAADTPLGKAISGLLPDTEVPLQVALAPFVVPGQRDATVAIVMGAREDVPASAADGRVTENVDLLTTAFTPEGAPRGSKTQSAKVVIRAGASGDARFEILSRIDLKPGRYQLRFAAHNRSRSKSGSVYADVEVPDFAGAPLSASGVVLNASPGLLTAPADALAAILPLAPTAERAFLVTQRVTSFLRLYQTGKSPLAPATVAIRIVDSHDRAVVTETQTLGADRFRLVEVAGPEPAAAMPGRGRREPLPAASATPTLSGLPTADLTFPVPLSKLGPGPHLLTFEVTAGAAKVTRSVRFAVR
jgi:VWFA-related protein